MYILRIVVVNRIANKIEKYKDNIIVSAVEIADRENEPSPTQIRLKKNKTGKKKNQL